MKSKRQVLSGVHAKTVTVLKKYLEQINYRKRKI
jgi:hypothetical protein